jgi:hypothetical protein
MPTALRQLTFPAGWWPWWGQRRLLSRYKRRRGGVLSVCVFITAGPSTKLFTWGGGGIWEDMYYKRRRAEACVD